VSAPPREPQVKGTAIRGILAAMDRICPRGTRQKVIALLPAQIAPAVEHESFLAAGWYPLAHRRALLTFVLSPEFLMRRGPGIFGRYYDSGTLTVPVARNGYCEAQYRGCAGFDHVLWTDLHAGSAAVLEVCGAKDLKYRVVRGGGDGDEDCDIVGEWR